MENNNNPILKSMGNKAKKIVKEIKEIEKALIKNPKEKELEKKIDKLKEEFNQEFKEWRIKDQIIRKAMEKEDLYVLGWLDVDSIWEKRKEYLNIN